MGRKGSCIPSVKRVLSSKSKEKKDKKKRKSRRWFWKKSSKGLDSRQEGVAAVNPAPPSPVPEVSLVDAEGEQTKYVDSVVEVEHEQASQANTQLSSEIEQENDTDLAMDAESEQAMDAHVVEASHAHVVEERHAPAVSGASVDAPEPIVAASQAARLPAAARSPAKSKEEISALKIQAVFKGYMARRTSRSIKGLRRLKTLIQGKSVSRQAITTLRCMQTMTRIQAEVRGRRIRMSEENCAFQRQLQQKHHREEKSRPSVGDNWNGSAQSKEQFEATQQRKLEAAVKRERTLAYAYSHQQTWRNSLEASPTHSFMHPDNPQWGWNWLERWMAVRPWENRAVEKEQIAATLTQNRRDSDLIKKPSSKTTPKRQSVSQGRPSVSTPRARTHNVRVQNSRNSVSSVESAQSDRYRRHSTVTRDDESVASSSALPSYMFLTESAKAKSRLSYEKTVLAEKDSATGTKKRLSFETSPSATTTRRHSLLH